jgi:DNA repair photolyase
LDFETKILVKRDAPELLDREFSSPRWKPQTIVCSGNTDCYQPVEQKLQITRRCLEVFLRHKHPLSMITKNGLIERDADLLADLASEHLVFVIVSITTLDQALQKKMEPRTSSPQKRLNTVKLLTDAGIPVGVNVAPVIPGLNDVEIPAILSAAYEHGARWASHIIVRLPHSVKDLFIDWVRREFPDRAEKIFHRIKSVRDGHWSSTEFGKRMTGEGPHAEAIHSLFESRCRQLGMNQSRVDLSTEKFIRSPSHQIRLFVQIFRNIVPRSAVQSADFPAVPNPVEEFFIRNISVSLFG